jgi:hypothetical protein
MAQRPKESTLPAIQPGTAQTRVWDHKSLATRTFLGHPRRTSITIAVIKGAHSLIFLSMAASILYTLYSGVMNRISRLTVISIGAVMGEGLMLLLNNMRCPLTDVVEDLGSTHGSVSDIFLPDWFAERIPVLFTPPFAVGLAAISLRRVRRQPLVAAICATVACLFLMGPWLFRKTDRAHSLR